MESNREKSNIEGTQFDSATKIILQFGAPILFCQLYGSLYLRSQEAYILYYEHFFGHTNSMCIKYEKDFSLWLSFKQIVEARKTEKNI